MKYIVKNYSDRILLARLCISCRSVLLVEETTDLSQSLTNVITYCCIGYTSSWTGFELKTLVVIGTDCTGSCKSNYHTCIYTSLLPCPLYLICPSKYWIKINFFTLQRLYLLVVNSYGN